jgi:hypothetical protein
VIVAVIAMRMMQASIDKIIQVVAMWNRLMTASRAMLMRRIVSTGAVLQGAAIRIGGCDFHHVFLNTALIHVLQVTVVEVIDVALMPNRDVTTVRPVDMVIGAVGMTRGGHASSFPEHKGSGPFVGTNG